MLEFQDFEEKTIERKEIFKGQIIDVYVDQVALPTGGTATRELIFHNGAVGVIPITAENKIILVKQFRKPLEKVILEIPAGKIEKGENQDPLAAAKRELEEETTYQADNLSYINYMYVSPGFSNEKIYLYEATGLTKVEHPLPQDEDEVLELYQLTLDEAKQAIKDELICDAKTIFAVSYFELLLLKKGEI